MKNKKQIKNYIFLSIGALIMFYPFFFMVMGSLMTELEFKSIPPSFFPDNILISNYKAVFDLVPFGVMFLNSLIVTTVRVFLALFTSLITAFAFAKIKFPGRGIIFALILSIMMIPSQVFLFPQYLLVSNLGLTNTILALIVPGLASAYGIFYMRQQIKSIPNEIIESAQIDGASVLTIIFKICGPMVKPGLVVLGLSAGLGAWNDFMWPLIVNSDQAKLTLPVGINLLSGQYVINTPVQLAGATMAIVPVIIAFLILQKFFENQGFGSAVK